MMKSNKKTVIQKFGGGEKFWMSEREFTGVVVGKGMNPLLIPIIQTIIDFVFLILLLVPKYYQLFFKIDKE